MTITALEYSWAERPDSVPITTQELEIALKLANWNVEEAAKHLRTSVERVAGCLTFKSNVHLAKRVWAKTVRELVTVNDFGSEIIVIVQKPKQPTTMKAVVNAEGNLEVTITFQNPRAGELRRMALNVLEDDAKAGVPKEVSSRDAEHQRAMQGGAQTDEEYRKSKTPNR
jgi:hypothetical protein